MSAIDRLSEFIAVILGMLGIAWGPSGSSGGDAAGGPAPAEESSPSPIGKLKGFELVDLVMAKANSKADKTQDGYRYELEKFVWFCCEAFKCPLAQAWAKANLKFELTEMTCDLTTDAGRASAIRCLKWVAGGCKGYYERALGKERYRPKVLSSGNIDSFHAGLQLLYDILCTLKRGADHKNLLEYHDYESAFSSHRKHLGKRGQRGRPPS